MKVLFFLFAVGTCQVTWKGNSALSSFIPGNGNDSTYFILHSEIGGSIKIQKFENNDQEYTTENMGELACPTDTGDEQSCTSIDVHFVTRLDSSLFFLSHDHGLYKWEESTEGLKVIDTSLIESDTLSDIFTDTYEMTSYPFQLNQLAADDAFDMLVLITSQPDELTPITLQLDVNMNMVESILSHKTINTSDIDNNTELAIAISITQSLVNFTIATQNSENKLQIYNSTQLSSTKDSSEVALLEGITDSDRNALFEINSPILLYYSQSLTGGVFIVSPRSILYSTFDGSNPENLYLYEGLEKSIFQPEDDIISFQSGHQGDFIVQTTSSIYYGKEGFKLASIVKLDLGLLLPGEDLNLTNSYRVALISLDAIVIINGSDEDESSHVIDLKDFFNERAKTDPCPVYDIQISGQDTFSKMDSIERLDSNSIIHGLNEAPTIISTPLPAVMKLNTTNIKWKERSDLDSRKISSSLTIDETAARLNGFQYGSRVIPQVTWFYADSLLSCRSKSYETVLLHYGQCPFMAFDDDFMRSIENCEDNWLKDLYSDIHPMANQCLSTDRRKMPKPLIQMTKYEAESTSAASISETTGLKVFQIRSEDYKSYQLYSSTEELRAQKSCGCKESQTEKDGCNKNSNQCKSSCKSRIESYGFANAVTKVGKPFIPTFELFSISSDENGCPVESSSKTINQDYTIIITAEILQNGGQDGDISYSEENLKKLNVGSEAVYDYTFNAKMVGCSTKPQNLESMLDLNKDSSDFTKIWSRENYDHQDCSPGESYEGAEKDIYPILGKQISLSKFREHLPSIESRITKNMENHEVESSFDTFSLGQNEEREHCDEKYCQNRIIFTKPGIYAATVILLDPLMSACNVRYSFIIKVMDLDTLSDQAFLMIVIITISFLLALGSFYMLQPTINHYIRKSVHRLSQTRKSKAQSRGRRTNRGDVE